MIDNKYNYILIFYFKMNKKVIKNFNEKKKKKKKKKKKN